jgi:hypothetical protein
VHPIAEKPYDRKGIPPLLWYSLRDKIEITTLGRGNSEEREFYGAATLSDRNVDLKIPGFSAGRELLH